MRRAHSPRPRESSFSARGSIMRASCGDRSAVGADGCGFQFFQAFRRDLQEQAQHAVHQRRIAIDAWIGGDLPVSTERAEGRPARCFSMVATRCAGCTGFEM